MTTREATTKVRASATRKRGKGERPCLEVVTGKERGRVYWLVPGVSVLGRGEDCQVSVLDDGVSRNHAKVVMVDDDIINLIDLGSTNGTLVNGAKVATAVLRDSDRIGLGTDVVLRFRYRNPEDVGPDDAHESIALSGREMEVAQLVAQGHDNVVIGEKLGISRHTVMKHLSNVYARAGVQSRVELATLVAQGRVHLRV